MNNINQCVSTKVQVHLLINTDSAHMKSHNPMCSMTCALAAASLACPKVKHCHISVVKTNIK